MKRTERQFEFSAQGFTRRVKQASLRAPAHRRKGRRMKEGKKALLPFAVCLLPWFTVGRRSLRRACPTLHIAATNRDAFSLLEVVVALAILTVTVAVLGELIRTGLRNAQVARDLSQAELICESTIAQIEAGLLPPQPVQGAAVAEEPGWLYSIEPTTGATGGQAGLLQLQITAQQDPARFARPTRFSVVRWLRDPSLVLAQQAIQQSTLPTSSGTSSMGGSSTSSATSGSGVF
jgi:general secretion pathway protein I